MKYAASQFLTFLIAVTLLAFVAAYILAKRDSFVGVTESAREFNHPEDVNESWVGPAIGERIDLSHFKDEQEVRLSSAIGEGLSMLVLVDPDCGATSAASDQLRIVQDSIRKRGVNYYLVSVTSSAPPAEFFKYTRSLVSDATAYLWAHNEAQPSEKLFSMVLPSHILVDQTGIIVRKWPGTSVSEDVRRKMAEEIVSDTRAELALRSGPSAKQSQRYK